MNVNNIYSVAKNPQTRSFAKTVTWRVLATLITGVIIYLYTGELGKASEITLTAAAVLTVAYYFHERFWLWIRGK
jgi:uncharacterized membrane protein